MDISNLTKAQQLALREAVYAITDATSKLEKVASTVYCGGNDDAAANKLYSMRGYIIGTPHLKDLLEIL